jgi:hypothetical protein
MTRLETTEYLTTSRGFLMRASISLDVTATFAEVASHASETGVGGGGMAWTNFYALSEVKFPLGLYLQGSIAPIGDDVVRFRFNFYRQPQAGPPRWIVESSQLVGGYPQVLAKIAVWSIFSRAVEARLTASYFIVDKKSAAKLRFKPRKTGRLITGSKLTEESLTFEISRKASPLKELTFINEGADVTIKGRAILPIQLSVNMLDEVEALLWTHIAKHLKI